MPAVHFFMALFHAGDWQDRALDRLLSRLFFLAPLFEASLQAPLGGAVYPHIACGFARHMP
jgi:hypothetical protein